MIAPRIRIRSRILIAALLPAILVALALAAILLNRQYRSLDDALQARARAEARQLASAAEFGVFSGSRDALQALAQAAQNGDRDILAIAILDARGLSLASTGTTALATSPATTWDERVFESGDVTVVVMPIQRSNLMVDDIYSGTEATDVGAQVDGFVVLEISRKPLYAERDRQLLIGAAVVFVGLLLASALAGGIALGVMRPIMRIGETVERIGRGDLEARVEADPAGVMPGLEDGINAMARRIGFAQEHLVQQIEAATAELRQRKDEAERANAAKTRFLAAASHDLRQPLHALGLFVSRLAQLPHSAEAQPLVGQIDASVLALQDLLDTLLDISRLDAGLVVPKPAEFPVADLFSRLALEFAGPAEEKNLEFRVRPSSLWLHTDPRLLARILMNFISNALRYTSRGGVLLSCRRHGGKAIIQVWDTGVGIPAEHLQDVFSEYVQLANPERNRAKGLGLGLAICDRLAQLLELPLGVRSRPGHGSSFWIEVPLGAARSDTATDLVEVKPDGHLAGNVVVIEDDALAATGMIELLSGWGCGVIGAASTGEAIRLCEEAGSTPAMAICNFRLGGGEDGIAAGLALRRRYGTIPVLLISGDIDDRLIAGAARRNFALLTKPVRPGKLRAVVQQMLARQ
jgi:signal transduction histidine kinase/CheY-like chemotaxis protein